MTSDNSERDSGPAWPFPAALNISAPAWQSDLTQQGQVPLIRSRVLIGNDPACDLVILDSGVARRHAALSWTTDGYEIEDLGSVNGTWVAGKRIFKPTPLALGAAIRIGGATLLFTTPRGEQATLAPGAAATHVAAPAPHATPPAALNLGTPLRVAGDAPLPAPPTEAHLADQPAAQPAAQPVDAPPTAQEPAAPTDAPPTDAPSDAQDTPIPAQRPPTVPVRTPTTQAPPAAPQPQPQSPPPAQPPIAAYAAPITPAPSPAPIRTASPTTQPPQPIYAAAQPAPQPQPAAQPNGFVLPSAQLTPQATPPQAQAPRRNLNQRGAPPSPAAST